MPDVTKLYKLCLKIDLICTKVQILGMQYITKLEKISLKSVFHLVKLDKYAKCM